MSKVFVDFNDELIKLIMGGAIGVLPTDTVYGLVAAAGNEAAVARLYKLKKRERKPGTVIAADIEQLEALGIKHRYLKAVEQFWPNAISIEIPHSIAYLNQNTGRQAFRVPKIAKVSQFVRETGPLLTTSANLPGKEPAGTIAEAQKYFGDSVDFYMDGGDLRGAPGSTIIRIIDDAVEVVREGAIKIDESGKITQ